MRPCIPHLCLVVLRQSKNFSKSSLRAVSFRTGPGFAGERCSWVAATNMLPKARASLGDPGPGSICCFGKIVKNLFQMETRTGIKVIHKKGGWRQGASPSHWTDNSVVNYDTEEHLAAHLVDGRQHRLREAHHWPGDGRRVARPRRRRRTTNGARRLTTLSDPTAAAASHWLVLGRRTVSSKSLQYTLIKVVRSALHTHSKITSVSITSTLT